MVRLNWNYVNASATHHVRVQSPLSSFNITLRRNRPGNHWFWIAHPTEPDAPALNGTIPADTALDDAMTMIENAMTGYGILHDPLASFTRRVLGRNGELTEALDAALDSGGRAATALALLDRLDLEAVWEAAEQSMPLTPFVEALCKVRGASTQWFQFRSQMIRFSSSVQTTEHDGEPMTWFFIGASQRHLHEFRSMTVGRFMAEVTGSTRLVFDELAMEPATASDLTWPVREDEQGSRYDVWLAARDLGYGHGIQVFCAVLD